MRTKTSGVTACSARFPLLVGILSCVLVVLAHSQSQSTEATAPSPQMQKTFKTPQQAAEALIQAAGNGDLPALAEIFGPDGKDLVSSADSVRGRNRAQGFAAKANKKNAVTLDPKNEARAILTVGDDDWPLPIPLVKKGGKWFFDSRQGRDEILFRRIGANELDAIQVCRGFVDAQQEYASEVHDDSGVHQYAQKIISTPKKRDGLVWRNEDGTLDGPISEGIAQAIAEGYSSKTQGYHGYYFKILKGQGPSARLGQLDYVVKGIMIGGFALVAVPGEYRVTGVKTFMISYDGIVYEKDLGPDSLNIVKNMERYNPDKTWHRTDDQWPSDNLASSD